MTSQNRRARPFYKPPASLQPPRLQAPTHLTRRAALKLYCFHPVQPNLLRCRETRNDSI